MNRDEFIYWLKGFVKATHHLGPTPSQWESIVTQLDEIKDCTDYGSSIDDTSTSTYSEKSNTYSDASTTLTK